MPSWAVIITILIVAIGAAALARRLLEKVLQANVTKKGLFWSALALQLQSPMRHAITVLALGAAAAIAPLNAATADIAKHILLLASIGLIAWATYVVIQLWSAFYLRRFESDADSNFLARKHVTQTRILARLANTLVITVAIAAALMTFEGVRQYGISLLASAGAAGLVAGLALQPLLKNIFAGIQLAITQPIRIGDALLIEGEWGNVEEITSTYVVLRIWDWRRLILPLSYFIEKPFQNWTREGAALIGTVLLYLDYSAPIAIIRKRVQEIAADSSLWDGQVIGVQMTECNGSTVEIRILLSAATAGEAFDLRCEIREKLIEFLQEKFPQALPHVRTEITRNRPEGLSGGRSNAL
jgi:small-conductance mechanosensitive channel